ncbi:hypothetical protein BFW01_g1216 [Lasiodiplodia theobromae]|uniref:N-acetyltransferase domain-containing protein n=1 Tax=Lasiodiplodia theobromae TaxID=45133 RepID=A0A8H7MC79_9PEZI|nr:hypothetical protein BFW01_g1216 [Lasiodiplodia theobromae]
MRTRLLVRDDVSNAAHVAVAAYVDDAQDAYIYPKRHEYPLRYLKVKTDIIQHSLEDSIALPIVAVLEPNDEGWNGTPEIMGFCIWYREGADQNEEEAQNRDAQKKKPWISRLKERILDSDIVDYIRDVRNPIVDASHARAVAETCSRSDSQRWIEDGYQKPEQFYGIMDVAVDPKFQRRGVARMLLEWGMARAEKENVPVHLSATPAGAPLYRSLGFRGVGKWTWRPNQEAEWEIMRWDPPRSGLGQTGRSAA